jgi:hypothetical protein
MTEIDTSMYHTAQQQPFNPLQTIGNYQGIANAMQQNRLMQLEGPLLEQKQQLGGQEIQTGQMELDYKNALMQAQKESMNSDGTQDTAKFNRLMSAGPGALHSEENMIQGNALNAPTTYMGTDQNGQPQQKVMGAQQMTAQLTPEQQQAAQEAHPRVDAVTGKINQLLSLPDDQLNTSTVCSAMGDLCADGHIKPQIAALGITQMPQNPADIRSWLINHQQQFGNFKKYLNTAAPQNPQGDTNKPAQDASRQPASVAAAPPMGYAANQQAQQGHYQDVMNTADSVRTENAALDNVLNISKSGAPSGKAIGQFYSYLAAHNLAPPGIEDEAAQLKLIQKHADQLSLAGGVPGTNEKLHAIQNAKVGDADLPEVIQGMVPYLKAVNSSKVAQANYYRQQDPTGANPDKISAARQNWQNNADPRLFEMKELQSNPAELAKYMKGLDPQDAAQLMKRYKGAKSLGLLGQ